VSMRRAALAALLLFAALTALWGVRRDLPNAPESDEVDFLMVAARIATSGDLNPHWFGHPGSTFIYPYAAALHVAHAVQGGGAWLRADPGLPKFLERNRATSILAGRLVSVVYAVLALWLICLVGDRAFGPPVGWIGGWFAVLSPITLDHSLMARTDGAGLFFGFLATWALLRLLQEPSRGAHIAAGFTLGLAIATRYFLVGLLPLLLWVDAILLRRASRTDPERGAIRWSIFAGLCSVGIGLVVGAPFLLTELPEVLANLAHETRATHPGADGLSPAGNLGWYLRAALPRSVPGVVLGLAAVGAGLAVARREIAPLLLLAFVAIFVVGVSFATLHWGRWMIQILPILALFAASAVVRLTRWTTDRVGAGARATQVMLVLVVVAVSAVPAMSYVRFARLQATPSTRDRGREWIVRNLAPTDRIAADLYTVPLQETPFEDTRYVFSLTEIASTPAELRRRGYDIAMVSGAVYGRFLADPARYRTEVAFYRTLFRRHELLAEFRPGAGGRGPVIRLYRLSADPSA